MLNGHYYSFLSINYNLLYTLNLFYKQQRFWATSLKLEWLLILVAYFGFDSENITSVVAYFPFKNIQHCL